MVSGMQECLGQDQVSVAESWENPGDRDGAGQRLRLGGDPSVWRGTRAGCVSDPRQVGGAPQTSPGFPGGNKRTLGLLDGVLDRLVTQRVAPRPCRLHGAPLRGGHRRV